MSDRFASFDDQAQLGWSAGELSVRPGAPRSTRLPPGEQWPDLGEEVVPLLLVPSALPAGPVPLMVLLHGATSNPMQVLPIIRDEAERRQFIVVVPKSMGITWDVIHGGFGPDLASLDVVLADVFDRFEVDPRRVTVAGFSDGASYALTLGLANGALFPSIMAFSAGFFVPARRQGRPAIFVSHGLTDPVLPIDQCGRRVVWALRTAGYDVRYIEFDGGHRVPPAAVTAALDDWLGPVAV